MASFHSLRGSSWCATPSSPCLWLLCPISCFCLGMYRPCRRRTCHPLASMLRHLGQAAHRPRSRAFVHVPVFPLHSWAPAEPSTLFSSTAEELRAWQDSARGTPGGAWRERIHLPSLNFPDCQDRGCLTSEFFHLTPTFSLC